MTAVDTVTVIREVLAENKHPPCLESSMIDNLSTKCTDSCRDLNA